ncbi:MAG: DUF481 domain-containing protein [Limisphaerales bacterium]|jgi:putative salt-induced outer membrane protein YdiY
MKMRSNVRSGYRAALAMALGFLPVASGFVLAGEEAAKDAAPAPEEKKVKWQSSAGLAVAAATGNTENVLFTASVDTQHLGEKNEWRLGASAGYGESRAANDPNAEMEKNTDYIRGYGQYDRLLSDRWYALVRVDAMQDSIADIDYRIPVSAGVGYYFIKDSKFKLSADAGPGYVFEKVGGERGEYATLRLGEQFEWKISEGARLWQRVDYVPELIDFENYVVNFELGAEAKLMGNLSLRALAVDTYRSQPAPGREENDLKIMAGLNYKF